MTGPTRGIPDPGGVSSGTFAALERTASPFDAGRIPCPQGGEDRWSARWLMDQLGYPTWQHFEPVVERAKTTAHNEGFNVRTLFTVNRENSGGRPRIDYSVTRYAAYLIAMNGSPSKQQVADAQHYFAVKTHEAEVAEAAAPRELTDDEIIHRALTVSAQRIAALTEKVAELEPKGQFYDELMESDGTYSMLATSKIIGWGRNVMMRELRKSGVLQGNNLPYQRYAHHFKVVPGTYVRGDTGETVPTATTFVRPSGLDFLRKKLDGAEAVSSC